MPVLKIEAACSAPSASPSSAGPGPKFVEGGQSGRLPYALSLQNAPAGKVTRCHPALLAIGRLGSPARHAAHTMRFSPGLLLSVSTVGPRTRITLLHGEGWREAAFESMAARQWSEVYPPIEAAVQGDAALPGESEPPLPLPSPPPSGPDDRVHWRLTIAYHGATFSGFAWQKAAPLPTVEGCLQEALRPLLDGKSELRLSCAGRTDAGVSALGQLVSFHSSPQLGEAELAKAIAEAAPRAGALRLVRARRMAPGYHATYSTAWRHYAYLLPPPPNATRAAVAAEVAALDKLLRPLAGARPT